jgi:zinc/manganese transport system substrate-binding protein
MGWERRLLTAALGAVVSLSAVACSGSATTGRGRLLKVVAAENFYGDLVAQIGASHVSVTSILTNPNADPHLFEPGSRTGLAVADAAVVVRNGAGYDDWMNKLLAAAPSSSRRVVTVADVLHVSGFDPNPHLWYDAPALPQAVTAMGDALAAADRAHAPSYRAGVARTIASLKPLQDAVTQLKARFAGAPVAYTERVPGLLLADAGLRVLTPPSFARSVEDGTDPAPADVATMQRLLTQHRVKVLLYNEQATSALTSRLQQTARAAGVPIVPVTETVPAGQTFLGWQLGQVRALTSALGS